MNYNDYPNNSSYQHQTNALPDLIADSASKLDVPRREGQTSLLHSSEANLAPQIAPSYPPQIPNNQLSAIKDGSSQLYKQYVAGAQDPSFFHNHRHQNPNLSQVMGGYPQPSSAPFHPPTELVAQNSRNPALCKATPGRSIQGRPVQAVAPQPRIPVSEVKVVETRPRVVDEKVLDQDHRPINVDPVDKHVVTSHPSTTPQQQQESLKIKLKKPKKSHKTKEKHSSSKSEKYGLVSVQSNTLKIKIFKQSENNAEDEATGIKTTISTAGSSSSPSEHHSPKHRSDKKRKKSKTRKDSMSSPAASSSIASTSHHHPQHDQNVISIKTTSSASAASSSFPISGSSTHQHPQSSSGQKLHPAPSKARESGGRDQPGGSGGYQKQQQQPVDQHSYNRASAAAMETSRSSMQQVGATYNLKVNQQGEFNFAAPHQPVSSYQNRVPSIPGSSYPTYHTTTTLSSSVHHQQVPSYSTVPPPYTTSSVNRQDSSHRSKLHPVHHDSKHLTSVSYHYPETQYFQAKTASTGRMNRYMAASSAEPSVSDNNRYAMSSTKREPSSSVAMSSNQQQIASYQQQPLMSTNQLGGDVYRPSSSHNVEKRPPPQQHLSFQHPVVASPHMQQRFQSSKTTASSSGGFALPDATLVGQQQQLHPSNVAVPPSQIFDHRKYQQTMHQQQQQIFQQQQPTYMVGTNHQSVAAATYNRHGLHRSHYTTAHQYSNNPQPSFNLPHQKTSSHVRPTATESPTKKHRSSPLDGKANTFQQHKSPTKRGSINPGDLSDFQNLMLMANRNVSEEMHGSRSKPAAASHSSSYQSTKSSSKNRTDSSERQKSSQNLKSDSISPSKSKSSRYVIPSMSSSKKKTSGLQSVRVKFVADSEEADIYKLKDLLYPDDSPVACFDDLVPGTKVIAKWPGNSKFYEARIINPLDSGGRRFRERRPAPKPYQASSNEYKKHDQSVSKLLYSDDESYSKNNDDSGFQAYKSISERIKNKRSGQSRDERKKARKRKNSGGGNLISVGLSEDEAPDEQPTPRKQSRIDQEKKYERRNAVESRFHQQDEVGPYNRFISILDRIFEKIDSLDPKFLNEVMSSESDELPRRLISRARLEDLNAETIKLKNMAALNQVPRKKLVKLLTFLVPIIRDGVNLKPMQVEGRNTEDQKSNRDSKLERVYCSTEAALVALNIMTSPSMSKTVYIDEVMERAAQLLRQQLNNTVYPEYDPVYKIPTHGSRKKDTLQHSSSRMKRAHYKGTKNRRILYLYNKLNSLLSCWVELVSIQPLTDTTILQVAPVGISPFFVENVKELQLSAIRLTTTLFSRYERHRKNILDDIFESMARLPTSKRNLRSYRLNYAEETLGSSDEEEDTAAPSKKNNLQYIQMVSALILQMIQAIIQLPQPIHKHSLTEDMSVGEVEMANELKMVGSYDIARTTAQKFLASFLKKCSSKSEETDFRPLFENFLHDLLNTVNKPEWPASEMVLTVLGRLLVLTFSNKQSEMSLRVASLDYLGVVAAKLRRDALSGRSDVNTVKALLKRLEETIAVDMVVDQPDVPLPTQQADADGGEVAASTSTTTAPDDETSSSHVKKKKPLQKTLKQRLQCLVLGYLRNNMPADRSLSFALNFYVGQWHRDVTTEYQSFQNKQEKLQGNGAAAITEDSATAENKALLKCQRRKSFLLRLSQAIVMSSMSQDERENMKWNEGAAQIAAYQEKSDKLARALANDDATQLTRFLASSRPFSRSFDNYLSYILKVCEESAVALRTRAMKCLCEVVAVDPSIMTRADISKGVRMSLMDSSTNVREAAVDLIGRFIILKPDLVNQYYDMLTARILDTGVSVRKRVIRILRDLCHEHPHLPQLTDACVRMIRRVNDEEGIKKLVHEVFMKMWFTPITSNDQSELKKKALLITDIVAANRNRGYEWIEQLFKNLIDTPVENPKVEKACQQIVDCLVQHVILFENEKEMKDEEEENNDDENGGESSNKPSSTAAVVATSSTSQSLRLIATIQTLGYLAKIRPMYLVKHVMLLQPYLATKCETPDDLLIVQGVCKILELSVPLMDRPSETFLATLETEMMKIIITHRFRVVTSAVTCLSAIVTSFTHNYKLVWDCFQRMCNAVVCARTKHKRSPDALFTPLNLKQLTRALFIVGHLSKTFDFDDKILKGDIDVCVKAKVYDCLYYFCDLPTTRQNENLKVFAVTSLGLLLIQDPEMFFLQKSKQLYKELLAKDQTCISLKGQVLQNLQNYLQTEDLKQQEAAVQNVKKMKETDAEGHTSSMADVDGENIKEICDVRSGMTSSVMQLFLKEVLDSIFHTSTFIRRNALHTASLTLQQGLVHPNQCVPYLIATTADPEPMIYKEADQQLNELSKKYSSFVHANAIPGISMAYKLHKYIASEKTVVRGFAEVSQLACDETAKYNKAYCSHLYQIIRSDRKHRRILMKHLLRLFDDTVKTDLEKLIFVADNLAYFPYQTVDEPLFLMNEIEVFVSVSGSNVIQAFKEALNKCKMRKMSKRHDDDDYAMMSSSSSDESDDEDGGGELEGLSDMDAESLDEFAHNSLACLLLLWLKDFLKSIYGFTDNKIHKYSPTEKNRANEKQCHRRKNEAKMMVVAPATEYVMMIRNHISCKSQQFRRAVHKQYYQLKELMNKLDPNEEDSSSDEKKPNNSSNTPHKHHTATITSEKTAPLPDEDSDRDTDGEMPKSKTALDLIRQSTALKDRKKLRRSSHHVKYNEDSSSDEEEFKGF